MDTFILALLVFGNLRESYCEAQSYDGFMQNSNYMNNPLAPEISSNSVSWNNMGEILAQNDPSSQYFDRKLSYIPLYSEKLSNIPYPDIDPYQNNKKYMNNQEKVRVDENRARIPYYYKEANENIKPDKKVVEMPPAYPAYSYMNFLRAQTDVNSLKPFNGKLFRNQGMNSEDKETDESNKYYTPQTLSTPIFSLRFGRMSIDNSTENATGHLKNLTTQISPLEFQVKLITSSNASNSSTKETYADQTTVYNPTNITFETIINKTTQSPEYIHPERLSIFTNVSNTSFELTPIQYATHTPSQNPINFTRVSTPPNNHSGALQSTSFGRQTSSYILNYTAAAYKDIYNKTFTMTTDNDDSVILTTLSCINGTTKMPTEHTKSYQNISYTNSMKWTSNFPEKYLNKKILSFPQRSINNTAATALSSETAQSTDFARQTTEISTNDIKTNGYTIDKHTINKLSSSVKKFEHAFSTVKYKILSSKKLVKHIHQSILSNLTELMNKKFKTNEIKLVKTMKTISNQETENIKQWMKESLKGIIENSIKKEITDVKKSLNKGLKNQEKMIKNILIKIKSTNKEDISILDKLLMKNFRAVHTRGESSLEEDNTSNEDFRNEYNGRKRHGAKRHRIIGKLAPRSVPHYLETAFTTKTPSISEDHVEDSLVESVEEDPIDESSSIDCSHLNTKVLAHIKVIDKMTKQLFEFSAALDI